MQCLSAGMMTGELNIGLLAPQAFLHTLRNSLRDARDNSKGKALSIKLIAFEKGRTG